MFKHPIRYSVNSLLLLAIQSSSKKEKNHSDVYHKDYFFKKAVFLKKIENPLVIFYENKYLFW